MKKLLLSLIPFMSIFADCLAQHGDNDFHGVWADADSELVITGKYSLLFERHGDLFSVILRENRSREDGIFADIVGAYLFNGSEKTARPVVVPETMKSIDLGELAFMADGKLTVVGYNGPRTLELVERIEVAEPYEMPRANGYNTGECLQAWQLGVRTNKMEQDNIFFQIGTNKSSYVFEVNPHSMYLRSARIRHNDNGTLFAQNIRLMSNRREFTAYMADDNLAVLRSPLIIDDSLFNPDDCVFAEEGIYWSYLSSEPDEIKLHGCGETYTFGRPQIDAQELTEWFAYRPQ